MRLPMGKGRLALFIGDGTVLSGAMMGAMQAMCRPWHARFMAVLWFVLLLTGAHGALSILISSICKLASRDGVLRRKKQSPTLLAQRTANEHDKSHFAEQ
jgi:hypothetical protein